VSRLNLIANQEESKMSTAQRILCGPCKSDLTGPAQFDNDSIFTCPTCGQSDRYEHIVNEIACYTQEVVAEHFEQKMAAIAQGNKFMTFTPSERPPKRTFRFILDDVPLD
jgi:hypothetical protein